MDIGGEIWESLKVEREKFEEGIKKLEQFSVCAKD